LWEEIWLKTGEGEMEISTDEGGIEYGQGKNDSMTGDGE